MADLYFKVFSRGFTLSCNIKNAEMEIFSLDFTFTFSFRFFLSQCFLQKLHERLKLIIIFLMLWKYCIYYVFTISVLITMAKCVLFFLITITGIP